ncbi:MAG: ribonuclease P protein component [Patescibacteria group bacterium]|nr:ribonuclease P protein component [Patescibacteria group bacterium]
MLPKKKRINRNEFKALMKNGQVLTSPFFVFRYINKGNFKIACVVPKAVNKKAVKRNKLKRKAYSSLLNFSVKEGQGIFFLKKEASFMEIKKDIEFLLKKSNFI